MPPSKKRLNIGTKLQVMNGTAQRTAGGLKKKDLTRNKRGKVVSRRMRGGAIPVIKYGTEELFQPGQIELRHAKDGSAMYFEREKNGRTRIVGSEPPEGTSVLYQLSVSTEPPEKTLDQIAKETNLNEATRQRNKALIAHQSALTTPSRKTPVAPTANEGGPEAAVKAAEEKAAEAVKAAAEEGGGGAGAGAGATAAEVVAMAVAVPGAAGMEVQGTGKYNLDTGLPMAVAVPEAGNQDLTIVKRVVTNALKNNNKGKKLAKVIQTTMNNLVVTGGLKTKKKPVKKSTKTKKKKSTTKPKKKKSTTKTKKKSTTKPKKKKLSTRKK
jgi:hypothetical protein